MLYSIPVENPDLDAAQSCCSYRSCHCARGTARCWRISSGLGFNELLHLCRVMPQKQALQLLACLGKRQIPMQHPVTVEVR